MPPTVDPQTAQSLTSDQAQVKPALRHQPRAAAAQSRGPGSLPGDAAVQAIKYEHLYRPQINDGLVLAREVEIYLTIYNTIRPHEAIGFATPISRYLQAPSTPPGTNLQAPATVSDS
jgi:transposase InsO family protein